VTKASGLGTPNSVMSVETAWSCRCIGAIDSESRRQTAGKRKMRDRHPREISASNGRGLDSENDHLIETDAILSREVESPSDHEFNPCRLRFPSRIDPQSLKKLDDVSFTSTPRSVLRLRRKPPVNSLLAVLS
jgi:hypothetical protein